MNFDELYKMVLEEKKNCKNPCLICHLDMSNEKEMITLKCNHSYHRNCLFHKISSNAYHVECPYCRTWDSCKKYVNKCIAIVNNKKCNKNTFSSNCLCSKHKNYKPNKCCAIITRGKNKGLECGKAIPLDMKYCKKHINTDTICTCEAILTRGKNKGKPCGNKVKTPNSKYCDKHQNYKLEKINKNEIIIQTKKTQCQGIIKTGKNKGKQCTCFASQGNFCKRHYKNEVNINQNLAIVI